MTLISGVCPVSTSSGVFHPSDFTAIRLWINITYFNTNNHSLAFAPVAFITTMTSFRKILMLKIRFALPVLYEVGSEYILYANTNLHLSTIAKKKIHSSPFSENIFKPIDKLLFRFDPESVFPRILVRYKILLLQFLRYRWLGRLPSHCPSLLLHVDESHC